MRVEGLSCGSLLLHAVCSLSEFSERAERKTYATSFIWIIYARVMRRHGAEYKSPAAARNSITRRQCFSETAPSTLIAPGFSVHTATEQRNKTTRILNSCPNKFATVARSIIQTGLVLNMSTEMFKNANGARSLWAAQFLHLFLLVLPRRGCSISQTRQQVCRFYGIYIKILTVDRNRISDFARFTALRLSLLLLQVWAVF